MSNARSFYYRLPRREIIKRNKPLSIHKQKELDEKIAKAVKRQKYQKYFYYFAIATAVYNFILFIHPVLHKK